MPKTHTWQPMARVTRIVPAKTRRAALTDPRLAKAVEDGKEMWANNLYRVIVRRHPDGWVAHLSICRLDRKAMRDWRHFQQIKYEIAGDVEAVELYPDRARTVDGANQFHLWCGPPGFRFPMGFGDRMVTGPERMVAGPDAKPVDLDVIQRPFEKGVSL